MLSRPPAARLKRGAAIGALALAAASCATLQHHERQSSGESCDFAVFNRTRHALEIRVVRGLSMAAPVGALNPGELLTESVSCAERRVWARGIAIPAQVGAPTGFGFVQGWADLVRGERALVSLHGP